MTTRELFDVLMQLQRGLLELPGVVDAGVVMATQANRDLLAANNLLPENITANPDDLLVVVKANDETSAADAIGKVDELLARRKSSSVSQDFRPRSLSGAVKQLPEGNWVLISVPGRNGSSGTPPAGWILPRSPCAGFGSCGSGPLAGAGAAAARQ